MRRERQANQLVLQKAAHFLRQHMSQSLNLCHDLSRIKGGAIDSD